MLRLIAPAVLRAARGRSVSAAKVAAAQRWSSDYKPGVTYRQLVKPKKCREGECSCVPCVCRDRGSTHESKERVIQSHQPDRQWTSEEIQEAHDSHALFTWSANKAASDGAINITHAEGIYFYDDSGKRYMDFNSMAMCSQHGHTIDPSITAAVVEQLETLPYAYPGLFRIPIKAKLCKLLAEIFPGDINVFTFPGSGAEANETALRMARLMTGRHTVMSRHRSYHGATMGSLSLTGDFRKWFVEGSATGMVKFFDPYPYSFSLGDTPEEICERSLVMLQEQLEYEGPHNVAAIFLESVTGANGVLIPPPGYLEGVRQICDENGILMVCDEVMSGFGRTGRLFGFCHADNVIPDIVTFAKGVNGAFLPMGGVGIRQHIADYFRDNKVGIGSTYNSHPVALASAYSAVRVFLEQNLTQRSENMGLVMAECLQELKGKHPAIKQTRSIGLFGCMDIQKNRCGDFVSKVHEPLTPAMVQFKEALLKGGLFTMMRGHTVFCNPPLVIEEEQLREGFAIFDDALSVLDEAMED